MTAALLLAALLAAPSARAEPTDEEVRAQIAAFLGSIDTPIRAEQWRALGPKAVPILQELAEDHDKLPTRRARALEGLSHVGHDREGKLMVAMAASESEPPVVRMSALRGAGRLLGPKRLVAGLRPILESSSDSHVRATAAEVMAHRNPKAGCASIADQVNKEPADRRLAFRHAMKACKLDSQAAPQ